MFVVDKKALNLKEKDLVLSFNNIKEKIWMTLSITRGCIVFFPEKIFKVPRYSGTRYPNIYIDFLKKILNIVEIRTFFKELVIQFSRARDVLWLHFIGLYRIRNYINIEPILQDVIALLYSFYCWRPDSGGLSTRLYINCKSRA